MDKIKKQLNEGDVVIQKHPFGVNKMPVKRVTKTIAFLGESGAIKVKREYEVLPNGIVYIRRIPRETWDMSSWSVIEGGQKNG